MVFYCTSSALSGKIRSAKKIEILSINQIISFNFHNLSLLIIEAITLKTIKIIDRSEMFGQHCLGVTNLHKVTERIVVV